MSTQETARGTFIVIDGVDGTGKATQTKLLTETLRQEGFLVETISFPRYGTKAAGPTEEYLQGKLGTPQEVGPYRASVLFAVDRYLASPQISAWLAAGSIVIADRYVLSNVAYQGGKIADPEARGKYLAWNLDLEYELFRIPRPDLNVILHVPLEVSVALVAGRGGEKDVHEQDERLLAAAEASYLALAGEPGVRLIECGDGRGGIMAREAVQELIRAAVSPLLSRHRP
jgi:dTMP kinase